MAAHPSTPHLTRSPVTTEPLWPDLAIVSHPRSTRIRIAFSAASASRVRIASITARRRATDSSSGAGAARLAAASSATLTMAPMWARSELWAASVTASWKSSSAFCRASGSAAAASIRRWSASISASCSSVRRVAASRAAAAAIDERISYSSRRSSARSMSANCHATMSASRRCHARRGRTRVPVFGRTSTNPFACSALIASRTTVRLTPSSRRQFVLVGQVGAARPGPADDAQPELVHDPAVQTAPRRPGPVHPITTPVPRLRPAVGTRTRPARPARRPTSRSPPGRT